VNVNNPHQSKGTPTDIVGKARISCTVAADSITLVVELQREQSGGWTSYPAVTRLVAPVTLGKTYTAQAFTTCIHGTFRTAARGQGVLHGVTSGSAAWQYSQAVTDPCGPR
jgi:hypothetical protein